MRTYIFNQRGGEFIKYFGKERNVALLYVPLVVIFSIFVGIVYTGLTIYYVIATVLLAPIMIGYIYKSAIEPYQFMRKIVIRIEESEHYLTLHTNKETVRIEDLEKCNKETVQLLAFSIGEVFVIKTNGKDYIIGKDFFDELPKVICGLCNGSQKSR